MSEKKSIEVTVLHQDIPGGGPCLSLDGHRVCWPKPKESAQVKYAFRLMVDDLLKAVPSLAPTQTSPAESDKESVRNGALENERAEFEQYFLAKGFTFKRYPSGEYQSGYGAEIWSGWQARASLKSQPAQPSDCRTEFSDTEMLDWVTENRAIVDYYGNGYRVCFIDDGSFYPEVYPTIREAINAAMRAEREGS